MTRIRTRSAASIAAALIATGALVAACGSPEATAPAPSATERAAEGIDEDAEDDGVEPIDGGAVICAANDLDVTLSASFGGHEDKYDDPFADEDSEDESSGEQVDESVLDEEALDAFDANDDGEIDFGDEIDFSDDVDENDIEVDEIWAALQNALGSAGQYDIEPGGLNCFAAPTPQEEHVFTAISLPAGGSVLAWAFDHGAPSASLIHDNSSEAATVAGLGEYAVELVTDEDDQRYLAVLYRVAVTYPVFVVGITAVG